MKERNMAFDVIRITAILAVVLLHASSRFVVLYPTQSPAFVLGNILDSISRIGVPLFVMLSGALMLDEDKELPVFKLAKKTLGMLLLLIVWSLFYALIFQILYPLYQGRSLSVREFFRAWIYGHHHLWYLYMILGLYLITPVLRLFVKRENSKYVLYYILLSVLLQFLPKFVDVGLTAAFGTDQILTKLTSQIHGGMFTQNLAYYLLGWYLTNCAMEKRQRFWLYGAGIAGLILTILPVQLLTTEEYRVYSVLYDHGSLNVLAWSVAVFVFLYYGTKDRVSSLLTEQMSRLSFGIYVLHIVVLYFTEGFMEILNLPWLELTLNFTITLLISAAETAALSIIPVFKKLVRA